MIKLLIAIMVLGAGSGAMAARPSGLLGSDCPPQQVVWGKWMVNRFFTMADGCLIQVTPIEKPDQTYREYVFDQSGRFMIFNSTPGPYETATSQQNYFLLPVRDVPKIRQTENSLFVTMASGFEVEFSPDSDQIKSFSGGIEFTDNGKIDLNPGGNVKLTKYPEFLVDAGWMVGGRKYRDRSAKTTVEINDGRRCELSNSNFFVYEDPVTKEEYYQPHLLFMFEDQLTLFLTRNCFSDLGLFP